MISLIDRQPMNETVATGKKSVSIYVNLWLTLLNRTSESAVPPWTTGPLGGTGRGSGLVGSGFHDEVMSRVFQLDFENHIVGRRFPKRIRVFDRFATRLEA